MDLSFLRQKYWTRLGGANPILLSTDPRVDTFARFLVNFFAHTIFVCVRRCCILLRFTLPTPHDDRARKVVLGIGAGLRFCWVLRHFRMFGNLLLNALKLP